MGCGARERGGGAAGGGARAEGLSPCPPLPRRPRCLPVAI